MNQRLGAGGRTFGKHGATIGADREASKLGITRQSVIKVWLAERLEATAIGLPHQRTDAAGANHSHPHRNGVLP